MINWQLSKQGIRWPVSSDHMVGLGLELIYIACLFNMTADRVLVFY